MDLTTLKKDKLTQLALKMKKGDRRAASELYDDLMPKVFGFLFTRTGKREIAEDLSQDIFVKLVEKVDSFDEKRGKFTVWFWQMVRHVLIDHYRQKKETPFSVFEEETVATMAITEFPDFDHKLRYEQLKDFLRTLTDDERQLFELRYVAELPYKEIATMLERSEGSLRVAVLRVKEKIKKEFRHQEI
ncbi:MAG TPA: RNA polymerase sigma factor [Candidatus Paceibacterota bacterium]|nr:RNA polymerase sigma factor [Candidatus Paceibacterota bacterium]